MELNCLIFKERYSHVSFIFISCRCRKVAFYDLYVSFESVFVLTPPSEDLPEDLAAAGYVMSQSDARRKRLLV